MEVTLQYFANCPNWKTVDRRLRVLAEQGFDMTLRHQRIEDDASARRVGFRGSPTVLVDGSDPFDDEGTGCGLSCRVYPTESGPAGSPSLEELRQALTRMREGS